MAFVVEQQLGRGVHAARLVWKQCWGCGRGFGSLQAHQHECRIKQEGGGGGQTLPKGLWFPRAASHPPRASYQGSCQLPQGKNHSLSIPPAQLTECHAAHRATLQHLLAGPPLPWQCCQGSDNVFFHHDFCCCFIFTPFGALLAMPVQPASRGTWERVRI